MEWQLLQMNILVQHLPYNFSDLFSYMIVYTYLCQAVSYGTASLYTQTYMRPHFDPFALQFQI